MSHVVLFDGLCGVCDSMVRFILKRDKKDKFRFAALQSHAGRAIVVNHGGDPDKVTTLYVIREDGRMLVRGRAALFVARELGGIWRLSAVFSIIPTRMLDWAYDVFAKNRYRWFGELDSCVVPSPETRQKFLA